MCSGVISKTMRKTLMVLCGMLLLCGALPGTALASRRPKTELQRMKMEQKLERKNLKAQERAWKRSFRGKPIPREDRIREKHQMQRDLRNMEQRQKDQIQDYKDHKRIQNQIRTSLSPGGVNAARNRARAWFLIAI